MVPYTSLFYQTEKVAVPVISGEAKLKKPEIKATVMYDLPTEASKQYTLRLKQ